MSVCIYVVCMYGCMLHMIDRIFREETNLDVEIVSLLGAYTFPPMNQVILAYHVKHQHPSSSSALIRDLITLQLSELEAYKIVPIHELVAWKFGTGLAVKEFLRRRYNNGGAPQKHMIASKL